MTTLAQGNARLLRLAAYVERRQRAKPRKGYDQLIYTHDCGSPACLMGHAYFLFPKFRLVCWPDHRKFFSLDQADYERLFAAYGCDNAGTDWRKAVAYVRAFVAQRSAK